ncbi:MAG: TonB-dependent receptor [Elusimicrobiota bacterium]
MSKKFLVVLIFVTTLALNVRGEEKDAFITLTRKPQPMAELPANMSVITSKEIEKSGARNVSEAIENLTSINIAEYGTLGSQTSVRIRNSTSEQVLVLMNGQPINGVSFGSPNLTFLPADNIERIEVVRGASSVLYGANAVSGVINIITKKPQLLFPSIGVSVNYGTFGTQIYGLQFETKQKGFEVSSSAGKQKTSGFRKNTAFESDNISLSVGYDLGTAGKISMTEQYFKGNIGVPGPNYTTIDKYNNYQELIAQTTNAVQQNTQHVFSMSYDNNVSPEFGINAKLFGSLNNHYYNQPDVNPSSFLSSETTRMDNKNLGCDVQLNMPENLVLGVTLQNDYYDSFQKSVSIASIDGTTSTKKEAQDWALYARQPVSLSPSLKIVPAARFDSHSMFGKQFLPMLSAVLSAGSNIIFSFDASRSFRAPTFNELYWPNSGWVYGNSKLKPETGTGYDLGVKFADDERIIKVNLFTTQVSDQIRWYPVNATDPFSPWTPSNVDEATLQGVETEFSFTYKNKLVHSMAWSYSDNRIKKKGGEQKGLQIPAYSPRNTASYRVTYKFPAGTSLSCSMTYTDAQYSLDDKKGTELPAYIVTNLRFAQGTLALAWPIEYFISVENVADERYISRRGYPLPGRTYTAGARLKFGL